LWESAEHRQREITCCIAIRRHVWCLKYSDSTRERLRNKYWKAPGGSLSKMETLDAVSISNPAMACLSLRVRIFSTWQNLWEKPGA
jgi:hypothetical protein